MRKWHLFQMVERDRQARSRQEKRKGPRTKRKPMPPKRYEACR
jgi:hypothetical protein